MKILFVFLSFLLCSITMAQAWGGSINTPYGTAYLAPQFNFLMNNGYNKVDPFKNKSYVIFLKNDSIITCIGSIITDSGLTKLKIKKPYKNRIIMPAETNAIKLLEYFDTTTAYPFKDSVWIIDPDSTQKTNAITTYHPMSAELTDFYIRDGKRLLKATKELILPLVSGDTKAEKKANKDNLIEAVIIYNKNKKKAQLENK